MHDYRTVFDDSYWRTVSRGRGADDSAGGVDFFDAFYARFLAASAEIRRKFSETDFAKQKQVLMLSLSFMSAYASSGEPNAVIEKIAASHGPTGHDIHPDHYDIWLRCLLETVREFDPSWSAETDAAWRTTLEPGIAFMKRTYADAAAEAKGRPAQR